MEASAVQQHAGIMGEKVWWWLMERPIYLDYAATTPCDAAVFAKMQPYFCEIFGNANSQHFFGSEALEAVHDARRQIAKNLNCDFGEVIFTSGATESSNIAILRTIKKLGCAFLTAKTQHASIIAIAQKLKAENVPVYDLKVDESGILDLDYLEEQVAAHSGLVSVCLVNNETGTLQDIAKIVEICHKHNALIHVDATQAFGKLPLDVQAFDIDFLSASGHKIYGPKGIGLLFCKKQNLKHIRVPRANLEVEFGVRAGTIPVPLCVGMAEASRISHSIMEPELRQMTKLRKLFIDTMRSNLDEIYINGSETQNYPGIVNISLRGCEGEALMMEASRIAVSSGSACTSNTLTISHVLAAMNVPPDIAQSSIRVTFGRHTTEEDVQIAIDDLTKATTKLRSMSAIWDMIKSGVDVNKVFERGIFKR